MPVRIVRLGTPRHADEGTRIGTVRRPPRGVPKTEFSRQNWYDVWFPTLAPSLETMKLALNAATAKEWATFERKFQAELRSPDASRALDLLAAMSLTANFSVGCYCEDEAHCHRSLLRAALMQRGAKFAQ
jgi:uncharacterized protein YeaO (DUF488 family)